MDFIQIGCIDLDKIREDRKRNWLERLPDEFNCYFVEVTERDISLVHNFEAELVSASYIPDESYICCSSLDNEEVINTLHAKGYEEFKKGFASDIYMKQVKL